MWEQFVEDWNSMQNNKSNLGCDYCEDPSPHRDCVIGNIEQILVGKSFADAFVYTREITFCPKCGRKLKNVTNTK